MTLTARALAKIAPNLKQSPLLIPTWQTGVPQAALPNNNYETYAREGYGKNELVYACIEEKATSAAEPTLKVRRGETWVHDHPVIKLLNRPNPFMDRFEVFATAIMHLDLAGNAFQLKVRSRATKTVELWPLRPDRVRIIPHSDKYIQEYQYVLPGQSPITIPVSDIVHYKMRNPGGLYNVNEMFGMPALMAASGRVDIDNYMKDFVKAFFQNAGVPAGILSTKQTIRPDMRKEIQQRFRNEFGGPSGWHELLILDAIEATFTPMTAQMGQRGLVIPELDEISEARICSVFGVPQSLVGTRTSYQNGGYANKRAEEQDFWTGTMAPLYVMLGGRLTLGLADEFGIDEIAFDLSTVRALQDDADKIALRWSGLAREGIASRQEAREKVGLPRDWSVDDTFLVPSKSTLIDGNDEVVPLTPPAETAPVPALASAPSSNGVHA